ncbi:MAG: DNA repair protein RecO [bacterium]|nr:DNA repair protein RecO [bacterium]
MLLTTTGIVLKEINIGESDRHITILTKDKGIVRAFAGSARRYKNRKSAATQLLCYSNFTLYKSRDTYKVNEASPIEVFFSLREDIERLTIAQYISELCIYTAPQDEEAEDYLRLVLNSFSFLANGKISPKLIKSITELRVAALSGYMPDLVGCCMCGKSDNRSYRFNPIYPQIICNDCVNSDAQGFIELDNTTLAAMRHIIYSEFKKLYSFSIPDNSIDYLSYVTEKYVLAQTERRFSTLDFYHNLGL